MCSLTFRPCFPSLSDIYFMDEEDSLDEGFHLFFNDKGILWCYGQGGLPVLDKWADPLHGCWAVFHGWADPGDEVAHLSFIDERILMMRLLTCPS